MRLWRKRENKEGDLDNKIAQLWQKARNLEKRGQYKKAFDSYAEVSEKVKQNYGENNRYYADCLNRLAMMYTYMGDYTNAEPLYQKALEILREVHGENNRFYARALNNLAEVYRNMRDYTKAEPLYQKALEIKREVHGENHIDYAVSLNNLAALYLEKGDYTKAEPLYQKALEVCRKTVGENHIDYARTLNNLALLYEDMGDYTKAEPMYQKALEIARKVLGENHPDYATYFNNWAKVYVLRYEIRGDYTKAEPIYQKALEISRKVLGENNTEYARALNGLAGLYEEKGDYTKAIPMYQKSLEIQRKVLGENNQDYARALNGLAGLYEKKGDYTKAEPIYQKALEISRKVLGENHIENAGHLNSLARLYVATSRQIQALDLLQESVSVEDKMVDQVFSIASERQRMSFMYIYATFYSFLSLVFQQFSEDQQAIHNALELIMRRKSIVAEANSVQREIVLVGKYPQLKSTVIELNNIRRQISLKSLAGPGPGETLDKYKRNLEQLNSNKEHLETELARHIPEIQLQQSLKILNTEALCNALPEGAVLIEIVKFLNENFHPIPANGSIDSQWYNWRYLAFILRAKDSENVQMVDLGNAESIDKMVTLFRMAILEGGASAQASYKEQDDDRNLVPLGMSASSYPDLSQNSNNPGWIDTGYALYNLIFHPLLSAIGEDCKKLFIAPDGDLSRLPFEVLPTTKSNSETMPLIDNYSITYLTTARDILQMNKVSDRLPNEPIVAADPDFDLNSNGSTTINIMNNSMHTYTDEPEPTEEIIIAMPTSSGQSRDFDRSTINFNRLEGTQYEGQEISKFLGVQPWTEEKVLESKLKSYSSPKILHIATHGFFLENQRYDLNKNKDSTLKEMRKARGSVNGVVSTNIFNRLSGQNLENPMLRSGLALAGANTWIKGGTLPKEAEDGILTAEDVSTMDLTDTELVVLSACETGLGEVLTGEGVFGLRRSFVLAGAKTLVMSLWKVPDEQTKELMVDFYKRLLSGKPRGEALREAQLAMKEKYPGPYYWGAFICQGNPGPMVNKN